MEKQRKIVINVSGNSWRDVRRCRRISIPFSYIVISRHYGPRLTGASSDGRALGQ